MSEYYVDLNGETAGPFTIEEMYDLYCGGTINKETLFAKNGSVQWLPLQAIMPLLSSFSLKAEKPPVERVTVREVQVQARHEYSSATRGMYIVIGLIFGGIGLHSFYSGRPFQGLVQLLLGATMVGLFITIPWAILSLLVTTTDGQGRPFS